MAVDLVTPPVADLVRDSVGPVLGPDVAELVVELLDDTARTTITREGSEATIITGDIPAVWLRDSCAQMAPFVRLAQHLPGEHAAVLLDTTAAILRRHWRMMQIDPYANAFKLDPATQGWDPDDQPTPDPWCWERKFELDSLSFPMLLAGRLHRMGEQGATTADFVRVMRLVVDTFSTETDHEARSSYWFRRPDVPAQDTLARDGLGSPVAPVGLVWAGFRPSDDACTLHYNIPGNLFAARALREISALSEELDEALFQDAGVERQQLASDARSLADAVVEAVRAHGIIPGPLGEPVLAYEVDGLGNHLFMDDANNPSLLGLPYLDALPEGWEPLYAATRRAVLSEHNPWWFSGRALTGLGSPHTAPGRVWPIAVATQGLTSTDADERVRLVQMLMDTTDGTNRMHEGVDRDDPSQYTRPWFSWANSMFCELVLHHCGL